MVAAGPAAFSFGSVKRRGRVRKHVRGCARACVCVVLNCLSNIDSFSFPELTSARDLVDVLRDVVAEAVANALATVPGLPRSSPAAAPDTSAAAADDQQHQQPSTSSAAGRDWFPSATSSPIVIQDDSSDGKTIHFSTRNLIIPLVVRR